MPIPTTYELFSMNPLGDYKLFACKVGGASVLAGGEGLVRPYTLKLSRGFRFWRLVELRGFGVYVG